MRHYDAIVIGLGRMGSATVSHLATRGVTTLGLEQFEPLHFRGSSHGESRVIRQSYFEHPNYVPLLVRAYELWTQLQRESGLDLMTITGGLMIGRPDSQTIVGSQQSALLHQLPHEMLTAKQIMERFPVLTPTSQLVGLYEQNAGFVRPERCIQAHLAIAETAGADLHFGERVIEWTPCHERFDTSLHRYVFSHEKSVNHRVARARSLVNPWARSEKPMPLEKGDKPVT